MEYSIIPSRKRKVQKYVMYSKYSRIDTILINCLSYYAQNKKSFLKLTNVLDPLQKKTNKKESRKLSLRSFDYFVTIYSKINNISIGEDFFNVSSEYKSQLLLYNKNFFDPFCRIKKKEIYKKIEIDIEIDTEIGDFCVLNNEEISSDLALGLNSKSIVVVYIQTQRNNIIKTSLGQLNFFKWVIENGIYDYVYKNVDKITKNL